MCYVSERYISDYISDYAGGGDGEGWIIYIEENTK